MSLTATDRTFARRAGTLWRDTGEHVLALPEGEGAEVVILGGGSAVLWRLLAQQLTLPQMLGLLSTSEDAPAPGENEVLTCLRDLVTRGLVGTDSELSE